MSPAARNARPPQRQQPHAPPPPRPIRREFSAENQAEIQDSALLRMWRAKGQHVRAYELGGVMKFEKVAEVLPFPGGRT